MISRTVTTRTPSSVHAFFLLLMNYGRVTYTPAEVSAEVYLSTDDLYRLAVTTRLIQDQINAVHGTSFVLDRPEVTDQPDVYRAHVPLPVITRQFFDLALRAAKVQYTPGSPQTNLTFQADDEENLSANISTLTILMSKAGYNPAYISASRLYV